MAWKLSLLLLACAVLGALAAEPDRPHPLSNLPPDGEITTSHFFPDYPTKQFPAGEVVKVVLGIHNAASEPYNVSFIMGSLNSAKDFSAFYYNFTQQVYFKVVEPNDEVSVEYVMLPPKELPPNEYIVALTVFYEAKDGYKKTTFFNQTVEVVEVKKLIDTDLIFLYILLIGIFCVAGYFLFQYVQGLGVLKGLGGKKGKRVETSRADDDDEWVKGTPYDNFKRKKAAQKQTPTKKVT